MLDLREVRKISMLDLPVLERLQNLAATTRGGILEIGPYIGGSTIALASGHEGCVPHSVIDAGGSYLEHDWLPTNDIIADWQANMERFGQANRVRLFKGWSNVMSVLQPALDHCGKIGLFFFDANGEVAIQFSLCGKYMLPNCSLVLDDYTVTDSGGKPKADLVRPWVREMVSRGALIEDAIVQHTWFGRLGEHDDRTFVYYPRDTGHAWYVSAPPPSEGKPSVYEDGVALGPADAMHVQVRDVGLGAFSHWMFGDQPLVLFSTSDNTDPNNNGRTYEFR